MDVIFIPLLSVIYAVLGIYVWIVIASVVMTWLIHFNVINTRTQLVFAVMEFLYRVTEPILVKIRRFVPIISGLDISPLVLIIIIWFIQAVIGRLMLRVAGV
jgi:YggT family protein